MAGKKVTIKKVLTHDWFSGDINDIIVQCITKEGE